MQYFLDFEFDPTQKRLFKNSHEIPLTPTQSRLLALLIESRQEVLSKEDILDHVWQGRVVSEQVVFQNISQLRAMISDAAIKTFPKRGYQWQLEITSQAKTSNVEVTSQSTKHKYLQRFILSCVFTTLFVIGLVSSYWLWPHQDNNLDVQTSTHQHILLVPFSPRFEGHLTSQTNQLNDTLSASYAVLGEQHSSAQALFNSPYIEHQKLLGATSNKLLLSGFIYSKEVSNTPMYLLEYRLQSHLRHWQGYIYAPSVSELKDQLQLNIDGLLKSDYFQVHSDTFTTAELEKLYSQSPDNLDILKHLVERLLDEYNHNVASAHIEQMISLSEQQNHPLYKAYSQWLKGQLLMALNQYAQSKQHLERASALMDDANFNALNSEISKSLSDVVAHEQDFTLIQKHLYKSASQARLANRPVQEIRAYTLLSIKAFKLKLEKEQYDYLYQAKTLLADHQLDGSHYMLIFYHFALFAKELEQKQHYYLKVLEQPITPENYWVYFSVSEQLANIYLEQNESDLAIKLAENIDEPARRDMLFAQIYHQMGQIDVAKQHAQSSFNIARMQHIDWVGLAMAVKLLELNAQLNEDTDSLIYRHYIRDTASPRWQQARRDKLIKLGVINNPYEQDKSRI
ncbi:transcriptional regulator [Pseudoalteromonas umbrosa]|uniref:transcriptional regulator n=1 Tax=Pseudoalteromonas umbrosa TaxID=3048489 RepID=UPI0024C3183F|nr:winged helix-turn-helix domain-containing protein [Pseudoalteromonas sp. B95]MDK1287639.1 winged helix-turn-helix domain-containing protein [Pseudoalteromonas sp. B95]